MPHKKLAYEQGVQKALQDAGLMEKEAAGRGPLAGGGISPMRGKKKPGAKTKRTSFRGLAGGGIRPVGGPSIKLDKPLITLLRKLIGK